MAKISDFLNKVATDAGFREAFYKAAIETMTSEQLEQHQQDSILKDPPGQLRKKLKAEGVPDPKLYILRMIPDR
jgi:hypothetical protein